jgi:hypothetical protein
MYNWRRSPILVGDRCVERCGVWIEARGGGGKAGRREGGKAGRREGGGRARNESENMR